MSPTHPVPPGPGGRDGGRGRRSRLRLAVIQILVFSLFATLFVRLYYLQVVTGEEYTARAAAQSVREIVVQPERGLIVDNQGRPLVTNRLSWVVSLDRGMLGRLAERDRQRLVRRLAEEIDVRPERVTRRLVTCGEEGSVAGLCWNGSPFQPVPVAHDVRQAVALRILEQPEDFPAVVVDRQSVRAYPRPFGINAAHVLGYLSPVTDDELDRAEEGGDRSVNGASTVGRAGVEQESIVARAAPITLTRSNRAVRAILVRQAQPRLHQRPRRPSHRQQL